MSKFFWILFLFSSSFLLAQNSDTIFIQKVDSLINVAATFSKERNFDKALEINDLAQTISMDHFGPNSTVFGSVSFQYGRIFYLKGDHTTAEKWFLTAISILEKANSKNFPKYADALYDLGCLYDDIGKYTESEALLLNAKDIRAESLGKSHADYQENLVSLGILYYHLHNYERAGEYYKEANALALLVSGKNSFTYCNSLHNLAQLYSVLGKNDEAERYYLEAIDIHARLEGTENASHAVYLNNLGILYKEAGMYNKAESLFQESLQIREKVFGKEHPRYAKSLNSLGNLYHFIGENDKAEEVLLQAISILEKTQVKPDITYANCLGNLGGVYRDLRQFELAEQTLLKSEDVMEVIFGKDDVECTWSLMNLGLLYRFIGNFDQASALFLRSKDIREKSMGKENTYYEECLDQLALLYWAKGDQKSAITYLEEANEIEQRTLSNLSQYSSEHGLASFIHNFSGRRDRDFSFCQVEPSISGICYNNTLFHKGFLLNSVSQVFKNAIRDSTTNEQFNNLKALHRQIAAEYTKPLVEQKDITSLEERANTLEKILTRTVSGFGEARQQVDWEAVKNALKPDEIAIEFVHYNFLRPLPTDSIMYAALVIRHGSPKPVFIPLFEEKQLKALLKSDKKVHGDFVNDLYANTAPNDLYALVWQPMEPLIKAQKIYFSPSGLLHRLNLSAIPINDKELLADRYQFVELGSTRQLAIPAKNDYKGTAALLYGGIQYDIDPTSISTKKNATEIEASIVARSELNFYTTDSTLRGGQWNFLKWTEVEVNATEGLLSDAGWSSVIRKGSEATEASVKAIGLHSTSPRVLHLATHGFFFPDPANSLQKPNNATQELVFKISDSPMIRSGLILAGGNYAWKHGKPFRPDMEDGILTAYEISQMNLSNTELVVLSACETGLGDIQGNEGVYGLQRAFKIAGAKYLIMSLWQVPDFQTQELMTTFYSRWIEDKMTVPEAFQSAQKTMREKYKEPFLWAGFVLVE